MHPPSVRAAAVISRAIWAIPPALFAYFFLMSEANLRNEWVILRAGLRDPEAAKAILWLRENRWLLFAAAGVMGFLVLREILGARAAWEGHEKALRRALQRAWAIVGTGIIFAALAGFAARAPGSPEGAGPRELLIGVGVALSLAGFALTRLIHVPKTAPNAGAPATEPSPRMREARHG